MSKCKIFLINGILIKLMFSYFAYKVIKHKFYDKENHYDGSELIHD